jgi:hypothetical protein
MLAYAILLVCAMLWLALMWRCCAALVRRIIGVPDPRILTATEERWAAKEIQLDSRDDLDIPDDNVGSLLDCSHGIYSVNSRIVRLGCDVIRSRLGSESMVDRPANRLIIAREWRLWAKDRGLRATHISHLEVYVVERCFIPTIHDINASIIRASAARAMALNSTNRRSNGAQSYWRRWFGLYQ